MGWAGEPHWDIMHTLNKEQIIKGPTRSKGLKITGCRTISLGSVSVNTLHSFIQVELPGFKRGNTCCHCNYGFGQQFNFRAIDTPKSHTTTTTNLIPNPNKWATKTQLGRHPNVVVKVLGFGMWQHIRVPQPISLEISGRFCNTSVPQFLSWLAWK